LLVEEPTQLDYRHRNNYIDDDDDDDEIVFTKIDHRKQTTDRRMPFLKVFDSSETTTA
jgi:hypothetical protein